MKCPRFVDVAAISLLFIVFSGPAVLAESDSGVPNKNADEQVLTGVVFEDADGDGTFDAGEGVAGVSVITERGGIQTVTGENGRYTLPLKDIKEGKLNVSFSGGSMYAAVRQSVTVVAGKSAELNVNAGVEETVSYAGALNLPTATENGDLLSTKMRIKLNFAKNDKDSIRFKGFFNLPVGFVPSGKTVVFNIAGIRKEFVLDSKGIGRSGDDKVKIKKRRRAGGNFVAGGITDVQINLRRGDFETTLAAAGIVNKTTSGENREISIFMELDTLVYFGRIELEYKAKANRTGKLKMVKE